MPEQPLWFVATVPPCLFSTVSSRMQELLNALGPDWMLHMHKFIDSVTPQSQWGGTGGLWTGTGTISTSVGIEPDPTVPGQLLIFKRRVAVRGRTVAGSQGERGLPGPPGPRGLRGLPGPPSRIEECIVGLRHPTISRVLGVSDGTLQGWTRYTPQMVLERAGTVTEGLQDRYERIARFNDRGACLPRFARMTNLLKDIVSLSDARLRTTPSRLGEVFQGEVDSLMLSTSTPWVLIALLIAHAEGNEQNEQTAMHRRAAYLIERAWAFCHIRSHGGAENFMRAFAPDVEETPTVPAEEEV